MKTTLCVTAVQLLEIRAAFRRVFGSGVDYTRAVMLPENDTGGWAPTSLLVVHKENGIPDRYYYPQADKLWERVEKLVEGILSRSVFFEDVNGAVSALYEA